MQVLRVRPNLSGPQAHKVQGLLNCHRLAQRNELRRHKTARGVVLILQQRNDFRGGLHLSDYIFGRCRLQCPEHIRRYVRACSVKDDRELIDCQSLAKGNRLFDLKILDYRAEVFRGQNVK